LLYILIVNNIATNIEKVLFYSMFQLSLKSSPGKLMNTSVTQKSKDAD